MTTHQGREPIGPGVIGIIPETYGTQTTEPGQSIDNTQDANPTPATQLEPISGTNRTAQTKLSRKEDKVRPKTERVTATGGRRIKVVGVLILLLVAATTWLLWQNVNALAALASIPLLLALLFASFVYLISPRIRYVQRPIPTMGRPFTMYKWLQKFKIGYIPELSLEEQLHLEQKRHHLLAQEVDAEIAVFGPKGGVGKSTVATIMAILSALASHLDTLIVDSRHKRGNIAERFGMGRKADGDDMLAFVPQVTVTIRQAIRAFKDGLFTIPVITDRVIRSFPSCHLSVIASDIIAKNYGDIDVDTFSKMMNHLSKKYPCVLYEADNDLGHALDLELMRRCNIPVFVTRVNLAFATTELMQAVTMYRNYNDGEFRDKIDRHGRLVVLATKRSDTVEKYAKMFGFRSGQVFLVPFDRYFEIPEDEAGVVVENEKAPREPIINPDTMPIRAQLIYLRCFNSGLASLKNAKRIDQPAGQAPEGKYRSGDGSLTTTDGLAVGSPEGVRAS